MNFKRNCFLIIGLLVGALTVSSCSFSGPTRFEHCSYIAEKEDSHEDITGDGFIKHGNYDRYHVITPSTGEPVDLGTAYDVFNKHSGQKHIRSTGKQKLIVIPVDFKDFTVENLSTTKEEYVQNLNKAFFGKQENNAYVSVANYLNVSSYGKLQLDGKVCDKFYTFPLSIKDIIDQKVSRDVLVSTYYSKILDWYNDNYNDIADYRVEDLEEGKNVPIYLVYTYPSDSKNEGSTFFWAYTFNDVPLSWASSSFMYLNYGEPDAHTYIHEVGHLLGLIDYYPTIQNETASPDPAGRIDMMDCSIGDETGYSKMYLDWVRPYEITGSTTIKISSFTDTGDLLLLANDWNKTVFDEYFLIEFYTPTGLNTYDCSYGNSQAKLPTIPGVKIYHVDSRLAYFNVGKTREIISYCDEGEVPVTSNNVGYAHDNNTYTNPTKYEKNMFYELILNHSSMQSGCATNANLFRAGDEINSLSMHNGYRLNFNIRVDSMDFNGATLVISKVA